MRKTPSTNTLYYGDNLAILRDYIEDESVDLIYLDPPFNSNATYNVLFKTPGGGETMKARVRRRSRPSRILGTGDRTRSWRSTR